MADMDRLRCIEIGAIKREAWQRTAGYEYVPPWSSAVATPPHVPICRASGGSANKLRGWLFKTHVV